MQIAADIILSIIISPTRQTRSRILRNPAKGGQWLEMEAWSRGHTMLCGEANDQIGVSQEITAHP